MPHPEHAVDELLGSTDGRTILRGLRALAERRQRTLA
jgi:phosphoribosylformylglycinamidine (FGAM) synthase-like amidotransferase family enzyme